MSLIQDVTAGETHICHRGYHQISLSKTHFKTGPGQGDRRGRGRCSGWIWPEHPSMRRDHLQCSQQPLPHLRGNKTKDLGKRFDEETTPNFCYCDRMSRTTATMKILWLQCAIVSSLSDSGKSVYIRPTKCHFKLVYHQAFSSLAPLGLDSVY